MEMEKKSKKLELLDLKTVKVLDKDEQAELKGGQGTGSSSTNWTVVDVR